MQSNKYSDEKVEISVVENKHPDKFSLSFNKDSETILIKRIDKNGGWGQNLRLIFLDKSSGKTKELEVGPSAKNIISISTKSNGIFRISIVVEDDVVSKRFPAKKDAYMALATIPSRIVRPIFFQQIERLLNDQVLPVKKLFVTISDDYKRFGSISVDAISLEKLKSYERVDVIIAEDHGPASKYLGPLIHRKDEISGSLMVVVDDDRFYNPNLVKNFMMGFDLFPHCKFATGDWGRYFQPDYSRIKDNFVEYSIKRGPVHVAGFFGFGMIVDDMDEFVMYNRSILNGVPKSFWHDEGIIYAYLGIKKEEVIILNHLGCNKITKEAPNALCLNTKFPRGYIEKEIFNFTIKEKLL